MIKAVIFDFDGTIGDTLPLCIAAFRKSIEPLAGRNLSDEEIVATFGPSEEGTVMALVPEYYEQGLSDYLKYYRELHGMCSRPFDGIENIIRYLRQKNIILALVTGKGKSSCDLSLSYYGLEGCFDKIETGSPHGPCKVEGIQRVLDCFGLKPENVIYAGDAVSDIHSARKAGISIMSVVWGSYADVEEIKKWNPDRLFYAVSEFKLYLEEVIG